MEDIRKHLKGETIWIVDKSTYSLINASEKFSAKKQIGKVTKNKYKTFNLEKKQSHFTAN